MHNIDEFLKEYYGKFTEEDVTLLLEKEYLSSLLEMNESELAKVVRKDIGKERRKQWVISPDEEEKEKIKLYLIDELKKRPNITPSLFNALFGIGFDSYFESWAELKKAAGLPVSEFNKRKYDYMEGRRMIIDYALNEIENGRRITQKKMREELGIHYESYGFTSIKEIKKIALEKVVYDMMLENPHISLNKISKATGYTKVTIKNYLRLKLMRTFAEMEAKQTINISPNKVRLWYRRK